MKHQDTLFVFPICWQEVAAMAAIASLAVRCVVHSAPSLAAPLYQGAYA
jgi:hypothetical protein